MTDRVLAAQLEIARIGGSVTPAERTQVARRARRELTLTPPAGKTRLQAAAERGAFLAANRSRTVQAFLGVLPLDGRPTLCSDESAAIEFSSDLASRAGVGPGTDWLARERRGMGSALEQNSEGGS